MIFKSIIAIIITTVITMGAVYYGTSSQIIDTQSSTSSTDMQSASSEVKKYKNELRPANHNNNQNKFINKYTTKNTEQNSEKTQKGKKTKAERETKHVDTSHVAKIDTLTQVELSDVINHKQVFTTLMRQANRISNMNLQDQAHVDIVQYAMNNHLYTEAKTAMAKITHIELRDTARGQIGIKLAEDGLIEDAFVMINQVETEGLRDVLRLQVIEAVAIPPKNISGNGG